MVNSSQLNATNFSFVNMGTDGSWPESWGKPPRPRKRITPAQLRKLEGLYAKETHPTREERMVLAHQIGMELRSVTIWLQNKRQIVRKNGLTSDAPSPSSSSNSSPRNTPALSSGSSSCSSDSLDAPPVLIRLRPSLDSIARMQELHSPPTRCWPLPTTAAAPEQGDIWKHMPSSPPSSPPQPPPAPLARHKSAHNLHKTTGRPYPVPRTASLDSGVRTRSASTSSSKAGNKADEAKSKFMRPSMTLEWACANASQRSQDLTEEDDGALTEKEEEDESQHPALKVPMGKLPSKGVDTSNAEMQAALALAGMIYG